MKNCRRLILMCFVVALSCAMVSAQNAQLDAMSAGDAERVQISAAKKQFDAKNYDGAIAELNKVLQKSPNRYPVLFLRALSCYHQKKYDLALSDLQKVTSAANNDEFSRGDGYSLRAQIYFEKGSRDAAITDAINALTTNPENLNAHAILEKLLPPEAYLAELTKAITNYKGFVGSDFQLYARRADYYLSRKQYDLAAPEIVEGLKRRGAGDAAQGAWSFLDFYYADKPDLYFAALTKIINYRYSNPIEALWRRANLHYNQKKFDLAITDADAAILKLKAAQVGDVLSARIYRIRAHAYASSGKTEQALADLNSILASKFYESRDFDLRAQIHCFAGRKTEAAADEKKALELGGKVSRPCK